MIRPTSLALLALAAAPMALPPVPPARQPPTSTFTGKQFPPPGSPEDQAFLGELLMTQADMLNQRAWAVTATHRLTDAGYGKRLGEVQATQAPEAAERTEQVRKRLAAAWDEVVGIMTAKWFVDGRIGCRPKAINFEVLMDSAEAQKNGRLAAARASARSCLDAQALQVLPLVRANQQLDAACREAEAAIAPTGAGGPAAKPVAVPTGGRG